MGSGSGHARLDGTGFTVQLTGADVGHGPVRQGNQTTVTDAHTASVGQLVLRAFGGLQDGFVRAHLQGHLGTGEPNFPALAAAELPGDIEAFHHGGAAVAAREVLHGADERVRAARVRHPVRVIGTQLGQGIGVGGVEAAAFLGEPEDRPQTRELVREFQDLVVEDARLPAPGHVDQHDVVVRPARHEGPQHGHHRGDPGTGHHEQQFCGGVREQELSFGAFQVEHVARGGALNDVFGHQALRFDGDRRVTVFGGADGVRTPDPLPVHFHADPRPLPRPVRDPPLTRGEEQGHGVGGLAPHVRDAASCVMCARQGAEDLREGPWVLGVAQDSSGCTKESLDPGVAHTPVLPISK